MTLYGLAPSLDVSDFNIVLVVLGALIIVLGLVSDIYKDKIFVSESLLALLIGIALGPVAANFLHTGDYGNVDTITLAFSRLVIGIQLVLAGIDLPSLYPVKQWKSLAMLLLPIMTIKVRSSRASRMMAFLTRHTSGSSLHS